MSPTHHLPPYLSHHPHFLQNSHTAYYPPVTVPGDMPPQFFPQHHLPPTIYSEQGESVTAGICGNWVHCSNLCGLLTSSPVDKQGRRRPNWYETPLAVPGFLCLGFCLIRVLWLVGSQLFLAAAPPRTRSRIAPLYSGSEAAICPVFLLMSVYLTVASGRAGPQYFLGITIVCQYKGNWNDFCPISNVRRLWSLHILLVFWKIYLGRTQQSSCCWWGRPAAGLSLRLAITLTTVSLVVRQILTLKGRESQSSRHCVFQSSCVDLVWSCDCLIGCSAAREEGGQNETLALGLCKGSSHSDWSICLFKRVFYQFRGILNEFPCAFTIAMLFYMVSFLFSSHCRSSFIIMNKRETWDEYLN